MTGITAIAFAVFLIVPLASPAKIYFADTFSNGSTLNTTAPGMPTATATDYEVISGKPWNPLPSIAPGHLRFGITNTIAGTLEIQARFPMVMMSGTGQFHQLHATGCDIYRHPGTADPE